MIFGSVVHLNTILLEEKIQNMRMIPGGRDVQGRSSFIILCIKICQVAFRYFDNFLKPPFFSGIKELLIN